MRRDIPGTILLIAVGSAVALPIEGRAEDGPARVLERVDATLGKQLVSLPERALASGDDRTLAPYLYVAGRSDDTERLPLKAVSAEVEIAGVIARIAVHQTFENSGREPIEAVYVFPASTRAAVHGMRMKIGSRIVEAKIDRRRQARQQYEAARQRGQRASLLEQERPNVFTMNVANLMPGDRIEVELQYSELLVPDDAVYELVFPTVVGPRYGGGASPTTDQWIANPYLTGGSAEPFPFDIKVHLETGIALKELGSPSHKVQVRYASPSSADVTLDHPGGGTRDYVLRYRLAGDRIETGMLLLPGDKESFFLTLVEPPRRPAASEIVPREYLFVLDVSGSMYGFPLETAKELMRNLLGSLGPNDWFNVVLFAGTSYTMSPHGSVPATPANLAAAVELVDHQRGGGGTELLDALRAAYAVPRTGGDRGAVSRSVIAITDGYVGVEAQAFRFIRERLSEANLFAFGIGSSVNRALIEGMARAGQGEPFIVTRAEQAHEQAERLRAYVSSPVLTGISVAFEGFDAYDVAPQKVPDLMARRPIVLFGKYRGAARGRVQVRGAAAGHRLAQDIEVARASARAENAPLRFLWARRWVELLDDERAVAPGEKQLEDGITRLGLDYTLLTAFTSFVAIDSQVVNAGGRQESVKQPLPLPDGVSNLALGEAAAAPATLGLHGSGTVYGVVGGNAVGGAFGARAHHAPLLSPPRAMMQAAKAAPAGEAEASYDEMLSAAPEAGDARKASKTSKTRKEWKAKAGDSVVSEPGRVRRERALRDTDRPAAPPEKPLRMLTASVKPLHVGDGSAAVKAIEEAVRAALGEGRGVPAGRIGVKLTVDRQGRVVAVDLVSVADATLAAAIRSRLAGRVLATRASGARRGTVEVAIELSR